MLTINEQLTGSVSAGLPQFRRLDGDTAVTALGPLADLVGSWVGNQGWNLIAVPSGAKGFQLLIRPYFETITFTALGALVPNRGGVDTMFLAGLRYDLRTTDAETNQPLHLENGMWLLPNPDPDSSAPEIARLATIPHGDSVLALGTYSTANGAPSIPDINAIPDAGRGMPLGYLDPYLVPTKGLSTANPNQNLRNAIEGQTIVQTTTFEVSTQNNGGISNIPFVVRHANATAFACTYWIEQVKSPDSDQVSFQLQYSQQTNIEFLPKFDNPNALIMWPHVNINTLIKQ
jgi:hypothetical protein